MARYADDAQTATDPARAGSATLKNADAADLADERRRIYGWRDTEREHVSSHFTPAAAVASGPLEALAVSGPNASLLPNDPNLGSQWHISNALGPDIDVKDVWTDYTGRGVTVGVIDDGIDYTHRDLDGNYQSALDYDARGRDSDAFTSDPTDVHGTFVAGVIAAEFNNSYGGSGVAPEAGLVGFRMGYGANGSGSQLDDNLARQGTVDVSNNSWAYSGFFFDDFNGPFAHMGQNIANAAANGRDGLGTVFVFSAGNYRSSGDNVNYHNFQNSQYGITVGAISQSGAIASYSNPGAAVLVAAPGSAIYTTDRPGAAGQSSGDFKSVSGTSFSAPVVSGVVALMLDANPNLGYRDVQEILAYTAIRPGTSSSGWHSNAAGNWNGGGLHFSDDFGFGVVDAHAAVRLAETWTAQSTKANLDAASATSSPVATIPDNGVLTDKLTISGSNLTLDRAEVTLNIDHASIGQLVVTLTSPDGTSSTLVNRPGNGGSTQDNIHFNLSSVQFWGENGDGTWTLTVMDQATGTVGKLNSWTLNLYGDTDTNNDTYVFTDEFGKFTSAADADRRLLQDINGGTDQVNLAAIKSNVVLDLNAGAASAIAGNSLTLTAGTIIENAYLGDGNDRFIGNSADNTVFGGRGDDTLLGGSGFDTALYMGSRDDFSIAKGTDTSIVIDWLGDTIDQGTDYLYGFEGLSFGGTVFRIDELFGNPLNIAPVAIDDIAATNEDQAATIAVLSNDINLDRDALSVSIMTNPGHGTAIVNADGTVSYRPNLDFDGTDSFDYKVSDGRGGNDTGHVSLFIVAVNDAPVARDDSATTSTNTPVVIRALDNDTDVEHDSLQASIVSQPAHGSVKLNGDGTFTYTPEVGFSGQTAFIYQVTDGKAWSGTAAVMITVSPVNAAPVAVNDTVVTNEDTDIHVLPLANDTDANGDKLTAVVLTKPTWGTVSADAMGGFLYHPNADFNGTDSFTYQANDGHGGSAAATVNITVKSVNDAPNAIDDVSSAVATAVGGTYSPVVIKVLANDRDADQDAMTTALRTDAGHGTVSHNADGSFSYAPTAGFTGTDSFSYFVSDAAGAKDWATVTVSVAPASASKTIMGTAANNTLYGASAAESMFGLDGNDVLSGAGGNDRLDGGAGGDRLYGSTGNDTLIGGLGSDKLAGGSGNDWFVMNSAAERGDTITDFARGKDVLDIRDVFGDANAHGVDIMGVLDTYLQQHYKAATKAMVVSVDVDGAAGPAGFVDLVSLTYVGTAPLDVGHDILVD